MKKLTAVILALLLLLSNVAYAESTVSGENTDVNVTVSGISANVSSDVTIIVLNPNYTKADLEAEYTAATGEITSLSSLLWFSQGKTDSEGKFSFLIKFPSNTPAGDYRIYVNASEDTFEGVLRYISDANKLTAITAFNDAIGASGSLTLLNTAITDHTFTLSLFAGDTALEGIYNELKANERLFNIFKGLGSYSVDSSELNNSMNKINENLEYSLKLLKADLITDVAELITFIEAEKDVLGLDISKITDENKNTVYTNIAALSDITSGSQIQTAIDDSIILHGITNAENWGSIQTLLSTYADVLQIELDDTGVDYTAVYQAMYNDRATFTSVSQIVSTFESYCTSNPKAPVTVGGGNGGGGSGGGGGSSAPSAPATGVISKPVISVPEEEVKEEEKPKMNFTDVAEDFWAYDAIESLYTQNILNGKTANIFGANNYITREEIAAILVRAFKLSLKGDVSLFNDISSESWYAADVAAASSNGILKGYPDGSFGVGKNITRQDLAVMLYNLIKSSGIELSAGEERSFSDGESISAYAKEAVAFMTAAKIINGYEDMSFRPFGNATRAEAAYLINTLLMQVN